MDRQQVSSSNIRSIGWEDDVLEVEFLTGTVYQYTEVPHDVYEEFVTATSVGKFFHVNIKGMYQYTKVN